MKTLRDVTAAFAYLANTPAGALAVEVMLARHYGLLLAAMVEDDIGEVTMGAVQYKTTLDDVLQYNGPTARDARLLKGVWGALDFLVNCNTSGFEDRACSALNRALNEYNASR